jgi:hypothetical protein
VNSLQAELFKKAMFGSTTVLLELLPLLHLKIQLVCYNCKRIRITLIKFKILYLPSIFRFWNWHYVLCVLRLSTQSPPSEITTKLEFGLLMATTMKSTIFCVVSLYTSETACYFGGTHYLHLYGQVKHETGRSRRQVIPTVIQHLKVCPNYVFLSPYQTNGWNVTVICENKKILYIVYIYNIKIHGPNETITIISFNCSILYLLKWYSIFIYINTHGYMFRPIIRQLHNVNWNYILLYI